MSTGWVSFPGQLLESREFSDLVFRCRGEEFPVHKAVVCMQSAPIKAAVQGGFEETETSSIVMDNFEPGTVKKLIQFMYTGDYSDQEGNRMDAARPEGPNHVEAMEMERPYTTDSERDRSESPSDYPPAVTLQQPESASPSTAPRALIGHIRVNSIGDYYQVDRLVSLANSKIKELLQNYPEEDAFWTPSLPAAIDEAANSTGDKALLKILADTATEDIMPLLDAEEFKRLPSMSDFALELVRSCAQQNQS